MLHVLQLPHFCRGERHTGSLIIQFHLAQENHDVGAVHASQIKKLRRRICRMEPAPLWAGSYTQYLLYKVQDPFSACRQSNCSETYFDIVSAIWMWDQSMLHRSRNARGEFAGGGGGGTSSIVGRFLHPISPVQSSRSIQRMQTAQLFLNRILILCRQFACRTSLCFTDQETQEENFQGGTSSLVGQFLHPISLVQSSRSFQRMQTVQLFLNTF